MFQRTILLLHLHEWHRWLARSVEHEETLAVDVGQTTGVRDAQLRRVRLFALGRDVAARWQTLVADEVACDRADEKYLIFDLLLRVQAKVDENL